MTMITVGKEDFAGQTSPCTIVDLERRRVRLDREKLLENGIFGLEHMDPRARTFILLRSQIMNGFYAEGGRVLVVTSTQAGNGKTFVTANLACALSLIQPTVLIDLDLRRPTMATRFGLTVSAGVDDYLLGDCEWEDVGQKVAGLDLTLYPVREPRQDSSTLLSLDRLAGAMTAIRAMPYQPLCIIDTPPALVLDDVMLIARKGDGIVMVIEEGRTTSGELKEAMRLLGAPRIVGTVLNKSITSGSRRYDYDYYEPA
ncbi:ATPase [Novosphingobium barchaimii LL02]|uniref:ATPase n=1 Tax=Novosphingobium barchaimii LL02 TaxID=1114963 RepID=A0A0J7XY10_9SPHN|nr:CpsD/CapB family tyrosine-protein kinase [Novosphingobium barchaimii]KMS56397.1 ATPase [Novosphingobium barchaimii LL02]